MMQNRIIQAVVFDVDGTLYDYKQMRRRMVFEVARTALMHPGTLTEIAVMQRFRRHRERLAEEGGQGVARRQYEDVAAATRVAPAEVERIIQRWMVEVPSRLLGPCRRPGVLECFASLREMGMGLGVFSDYRAHEKLAALGLSADILVASDDPEVDALKPDPRGLLVAAERLGVAPAACLMVGDRDDKDGECARRAGAPWLLYDPAACEGDAHRFSHFSQLPRRVRT